MDTITIAGLTSVGAIAFFTAVIRAWVNNVIATTQKSHDKKQETIEMIERDLQALRDRVLKVETKMVDETQTRRIIGEAVASLKADIGNLSQQMQEILQAMISNRGN